MLSKEQLINYLTRVGMTDPPTITRQFLNDVHLAHLSSIPFENLDITLGRVIELSQPTIINKLLNKQRGGFCYELNYAFYLLLKTIGFDVTLLSGRVFSGNEYGKEFDHLLLLITISDKKLIADVGFGDSFHMPIPIDGSIYEQGNHYYSVEQKEGIYTLSKSTDGNDWQPQYLFSLVPRVLSDFDEMCMHQQTSPESHFTKNAVCTMAFGSDRKTLSGKKLITTINNLKTEKYIENEAEFYQVLSSIFSVELDDDGKLFEKVNI